MPATTAAPPATLQLVRFLLARIDEDDLELKRRAKREGDVTTGGLSSVTRLRAETEAKRRVIGGLQQLLVLRDQPFEKAIRDQASQLLRAMAVPYDDHASYRDEWRPSAAH
jgi:Family of unknown function (DUF6221)